MKVEIIKNILRPVYGPIMSFIRKVRKERFIKEDINRISKELSCCSITTSKIFYLGITAHSNLGDMGQYYCIHHWILNNYPTYKLIEIEANTVVDEKNGFLRLLKDNFNCNDIIIFQSGYTTQDLGGVHDLMHRKVIEVLPDAHILMMPQTIFFQHEENRLRSSRIYNLAHNMLFLARDKVSYDIACSMMPDVRVKLFPDIVTTLIGKYNFSSNKRHGVNLCRRNDGEKFYSDEELKVLIEKIERLTTVTISDTTIKVPFKELRSNTQKYINQQITFFSQFEAVITDRYHGTIYALAAGTPVIIIKTTDHKVITGADWFKGVYDAYVHVANDLEEAFQIVCDIRSKNFDNKLQPFFDDQYYKKLKTIFESASYEF